MRRDLIAAAFAARGYAVVRGFWSAAQCARLRAAADAVLARCCAEDKPRDRFTNIAFLTDPRWHDGPETLLPLLEAAADPVALDLLASLGHGPPLFHNTQYFTDWPQPDWAGPWHRDTQFLAATPEIERERIFGPASAHFRIALVADDRLDYAPGSERRWDDPAEAAARRGDGDPDLYDRIVLEPGDACLFHAWGVHRGRYGAAPRRTFDTLYMLGAPCDFHTPPPTCLRDGALLALLPPAAQAFFARFVAAYAARWT